MERPRVTLGDLFDKRVGSVEDVVVETSIPGLGLVSGEGDPSWIANPRPAQKFRLLHQVQQLPVDYLVVDLGPGSGLNALDFFLVADVGLLVMVPEPTSVENTYRFMKSAFLRRLRRARIEQALALVQEGDHALEGGIPTPSDLYFAAKASNPELPRRDGGDTRFRPKIVVNHAPHAQTRSSSLAASAAPASRVPVDYSATSSTRRVCLAVLKRPPPRRAHDSEAAGDER